MSSGKESPSTKDGSGNRAEKRFVAIDANSLVHRAFHAFPPSLATSDGVQVNAVYGFTSMLLKVLKDLSPKYILCAFDLKEKTFRHEEFEDYKAQRKPTDEALINQFPFVKDVLKSFNVPIVEQEGYEADDILGTLATWAREGKWQNDDLEFVIVTGDKDLLQTVGENVKVWLPRGSFKNVKMFDEDAVKELFGFGPEKVVDYKAMVGDSSDNIPGISGVGKKTATNLLRKYGSLDEIYHNLDEIEGRAHKPLAEGRESAELSRRLAQIVNDMDLDVQLEDCLMRDFNKNEVVRKFQELEFRSLVSKIPETISEKNGSETQMNIFGHTDDACRDDVKPISDISDNDLENKQVALCYFESGSIGIGLKNDEAGDIECYFSDEIENDADYREVNEILMKSQTRVVSYGWEDLVRNIFIGGISKDEKRDLLEFSRTKIWDVGLVSYYMSTGKRDYTLEELSFSHTSIVLPDKGLDKKSAVSDCVKAVFQLGKVLEKKLEEHMETIRFGDDKSVRPIIDHVCQEIEFPLVLTSAEMHQKGIVVDKEKLEKKDSEMEKDIKKVQDEIFDQAECEFNIDSSQQLSEVLFEKLDLPPQKKTKTGYSTDESVLKKLEGEHPIIKSILRYRELTKLRRTYVKPLLERAGESQDGRIHSTFRQTETTTGRLTSQDPNLQNIPTRSKLGKEIKGMFVAQEGKVLVAADYSQIDLRVMAHFSRDPVIVEDFRKGADFHTMTAARIFDKMQKEVTKDDRRVAKTINFGILYGMSAFGLSEALDIEREEAAEYIENYFEKHSRLKEYFEEELDFVRENGYTETLFGRRRYIAAVNSNNGIARAAAEREAINLPIQGTSADIMRLAAIRIYDWVLNSKMDVGILLQIHDEFVLECDEGDAEEVVNKLDEIMEGVIELDVPLEVAVSYAKDLRSIK